MFVSYPAGMRGTASPRAHPGASSTSRFPSQTARPAADHPVAGVALEHEVLGVPLFFTRLFHGSSLRGPAERSIRYGSRGPSRTSRPDRAKNKSPHHVVGTGWGEREDRVIASLAHNLRARQLQALVRRLHCESCERSVPVTVSPAAESCH